MYIYTESPSNLDYKYFLNHLRETAKQATRLGTPATKAYQQKKRTVEVGKGLVGPKVCIERIDHDIHIRW